LFGFGFEELIVLSLIVLAVFGSRSLGELAEQLQSPKRTPPAELRFVRVARPGRWTWSDWTRVILAVALGVAATWSTLAIQRARARAASRPTASDYLQFVVEP
jgi:hypothetical protein